MKAKDAKRAAALLDALEGIAAFREQIPKNKRLCMYANDHDRDGDMNGDFAMPMSVGAKIIDAAETAIRAELKEIGIET